MPTVKEKIVINAPPARVFDFVTNPGNWTRYVPSLTAVTDVSSPKVEEGTTFKWEYRMFGIRQTGGGRVSENVPGRSFGLSMEGTVPVAEHYTFTPADGGGTELAVEIEYGMHNKVLEIIASSRLVEKLNKKEARHVLDTIKTFCEEP